MNPGEGLFIVCSVVAVIAALCTVFASSPLRSALSLLVNIIALAGLYVSLNAHLLAAIQLMVYAGAVVVLFIFVIMVIGPSAIDMPGPKRVLAPMVSAVLAIIVFFTVGSLLVSQKPEKPIIQACSDVTSAECDQYGGVAKMAEALFDEGAVPFEFVSLLLLVAIIGAFAVARGKVVARPLAGSSINTAPHSSVQAKL